MDTMDDTQATPEPELDSSTVGATVEHMINALEVSEPSDAPAIAERLAATLAGELDTSESTVFQPEQLEVRFGGEDGETAR